MSTAVHRHRWTREEYERLVEAGGLGPEGRVELLDGDIWEMTPQGSRHSAVCGHLGDWLREMFGPGYAVRVQFPVALDVVSEPEPDLAVIRGAHLDYLDGHPSELLLVVEVSASSLAHDRGRKLTAYARNNVPEYWLVDLTTNRIEIYRKPTGDTYQSAMTLSHGETITPLHAPGSTIAVADMLP